ncbi:MAG: Trm112 family protein [Nanoarchaeota archaeon]|nr:Trm112 family protein [DPANN group archaeon]MBL7116275.1 Trm112 family protein [Nanoarchaeota archaeon]
MIEEIKKELFDILACPTDKSDLVYTKDKKGLQCVKCKYVYPIKEGIPVLSPSELSKKL